MSSARAESRPLLRSVGPALLLGASGVAIWLANLFLQIGPSTELDGSWQAVLNHAWTHGFVFGRDLVWTYGPWGWLTTLYYFPETFAAHIAWDLVGKGVVAVTLLLLARALSWPRRIALVAAALLILPLFADNAPILLIAGLLLWLARTSAPRLLLVIGVGIFLGFLSLQKFTYFAMVAGGTSLLALHFFPRGRARIWLTFSAALAASLLAFWLLAGQPLAALPLFLQRSAILSSGYTEAMFVQETPAVFWLGLACATVFLVVVWDRPRLDRVALGLLASGFGFLAWKHGFVRADGHTFGFFSCMLFAGITLPLLAAPPSIRVRAGSWLLCALALGGAVATDAGLMGNLLPLLRLHLVENTRTLLHLPAHRASLDAQFARARAASALPQIRARVGAASVDLFGYEQGFLLHNDLTYQPRPVFQTYQVYSGPLAALNRDFYRSPRAPAFTLARLQTIDNRLPALDDAAVLPLLFADHDFVLRENDFLLLARRPAASDPVPHALAAGRLRYNSEAFTLPPAAADAAIWATIDTPYSWLGWLRTFFYKPPEITLVVTERDGLDRRFRLIAPAARAGFLLAPLVLDTGELQQLVAAHTGRSVRSFRLEIAPAHAIFFLKRARFELSALGRLTYRSTSAASP